MGALFCVSQREEVVFWLISQDVTYIEAISEMLAYTKVKPMDTPTKPHMRPAVPPSVNPAANNLLLLYYDKYAHLSPRNSPKANSHVEGVTNVKITSHVQISVQPNPTMEINLKFLFFHALALLSDKSNYQAMLTRRTWTRPSALISFWSANVPIYRGATWPFWGKSSRSVRVSVICDSFPDI